jgi:hypothetical protein
VFSENQYDYMDPSSGDHPRPVLVQLALLAALAAILLTGCRHNNAINFATSTQFGVKVGVNPEKIPEIQVGYNRQEATRVPVYLEQEKGAAGKTSNPADASINSILRNAQKALAADSSSNAVKTVTDAIVRLSSTLDKTLGSNPIYRELITESKKGESANPVVLKLYMQAALDLPTELQLFHEQGKFIGTRQGDNAADAYSVLGTFSGDGAGSASTNSARVKIAQFFATGIAAQELARAGGAATVNPNAKSPETLSVDERAKEREIGRRQVEQANALDAVTEKIWGSDRDTEKNRTARAKKALENGIRLPDGVNADSEASLMLKKKSKAALRNILRESYLDQTPEMLKNLKN